MLYRCTVVVPSTAKWFPLLSAVGQALSVSVSDEFTSLLDRVLFVIDGGEDNVTRVVRVCMLE